MFLQFYTIPVRNAVVSFYISLERHTVPATYNNSRIFIAK